MAKSNSDQRPTIASELIQLAACRESGVQQQASFQEQPIIRKHKQQWSKRRKTHAKESKQMRAGQSSSSSSTDKSCKQPVVAIPTSNSPQRQHRNRRDQLLQSNQLDTESNSGSKIHEYQLLFESPVGVASAAYSAQMESREMSFMVNGNRTPNERLKETKIELIANGIKAAKIIETHHDHHLPQQPPQNRHPHLKHLRRQTINQRDKAIQSGTGFKEKTTRGSGRESSLSWKEVNKQLEDVCIGQEIVRVLGNSDWTNLRGSPSKHSSINKIGDNSTDSKQQRRQTSITENGPSSIREIKTQASTTVLDSENKSKIERTVATYLRQSFYSKNLTWQTNLIGQPSAATATATINASQTNLEEAEDSDVVNYETIDSFGVVRDEEVNQKCSNADRQAEKLNTTVVNSKSVRSKKKARSSSSSDRIASTESDTIALVKSDDTKQVLNCATAAITANFSPKFPGERIEEKAIASYEVEKKTDAQGLDASGDNSNGIVEFEGKASYKRAFFSYPSFSQQSATSGNATTSGKTSLSLSDAFDAASSTSKVRLTTRRKPPIRQISSSLHLSIDSLKMIVERNLVATLIGVYILVSLTVIVLILPYIINVPREITISSSAKEQVGDSSFQRQHHKSSHMSSSSLQTHDYEEFTEGLDKTTQTDPVDDDSLLHASGAIVSSADSSVTVISSSGGDGSSVSKSPLLTPAGNTNSGAQVGNVETMIKSHIVVPKKKIDSSQQQQGQVTTASSQQTKMSENSNSPQVKLTNPYFVVGQPSSLLNSQSELKVISKRNDSTGVDKEHPSSPVAMVVVPPEVPESATPTKTKHQDVKRHGIIQLTEGQQVNSSLFSSLPMGADIQEGSSRHQLLFNQSSSTFGETSQGARVEGSKFLDLWNVAHSQQCQPMKIPFCSKSLEAMLTGFGPAGQSARSPLVNAQSVAYIAYDKTLLPNQFTRTRQSQIERALQRYDPIIDIKCYALMPLFLCSIYAPKCIHINQTQVAKLNRFDQQQSTNSLVLPTPTPDDADGRGPSPWPVDSNRPSINIQAIDVSPQQQQRQKHGKISSWSRLVPPCRSMCKEAFRKCMFFFEVLSLKLLDPEDCESLPESSDPNVCVGQLEHKLLQRATKSQNCQEDKFRCTDGECIPKKWRCDGFADCTDRSDEDKCSKCNGSTQFYCGQDLCISKEAVCNGIRDCRDGRDERQCLRLSHVAGFAASLPKRLENQRQLEVWSAVKENWVPVCGAHWSAMPMSHEACQALGYSRANETLILFGPAQQKIESRFGQQQPRQATQIKASGRTLDSPPSRPATSTAGDSSISDSGRAINNNITTNDRSISSMIVAGESEFSAIQPEAPRRQKQRESREFGPGGWFDLSPSDPASSYAAAETSSGDDDEQLVGIVEDMDSSASGIRLSRAGRPDHPVIYERQFGSSSSGTKLISSSSNRQAELIAVDASESKWKSLTSMLYHGPQTGCLDKPAQLVSTVNLQCENFQCGRSITSYSTRVKQLRQQQQTAAATIKRSLSKRASFRSDVVMKNVENELPLMGIVNSQSDDDGDKVDGIGLQQQSSSNLSKTRVQKLEAEEELDPLEVDGDYKQQRPGEASEPIDMFKGKVQSLKSNVGSRFGNNVDAAYADSDDDNDDDDDDDDYNDDVDSDSDVDQNAKDKHQQAEGSKEVLLIDKLAKEQPELLDSMVNSRLVVGGTESMPGEFPYLAALHGGPDEVFFCGGVLISINWLLTASHCVGNRTQPDGWMVKVGVTRRIASPAFVKKLKLRKIIKHPNFNHDSLFNNDIALILLEESVEFNQYLRPICLPRANLKLGPDNSKDCVVVGFGKSKFSQEANYLHVAHFVNVPIVRHSVCSNWYIEHGVNLTEGMLCAGYAEGKRDACQGDSGSGLFCRYSNTNQFFVAGVVSFGIKCATPKLPGVYTSVPTYVDWIESTTREHGYPLT